MSYPLNFLLLTLLAATSARELRDLQPSSGFLSRKEVFLPMCAARDGFQNSICRVSLGQTTYDEVAIDEVLKNVNDRVGTTLDFRVLSLLRMLYLDNGALPTALKQRIKETVLHFRYWFTDPPSKPDNMIFWTENHLIVYHTCEFLAGQMFPDHIFPVSNLTGAQHVERALPGLTAWLNQRGRLGFAEWHSNPYYSIDIAALVSLVDFASVQQQDIAIKAAMLLDLIGFDMANNYYKGLYATSMGRTEDRRRVTTMPRRLESPTNSAHLILGLGEASGGPIGDMGSIAIATSLKYVPSPIMEKIADAARESHVHYERKSVQVNQGEELYGIGYDPVNIHDVMFWWSMSAPLAGQVVEATVALIEQFSLDPDLIVTDGRFLDLLRLGAAAKNVSLSEYCSTVAAYLVRGSALETANIYTYRTPHYQLSGSQDRSNKGWSGLQEHAWQATLDASTYVFSNSPSQLSEEFIGGWMPRTTLYRNVGVIQYDKDPGDAFLNTMLETFAGVKDYIHVYFPSSQFDDWREVEVLDGGTYLFGEKGGGYISLYSYGGGMWQSDFEWRVPGQKNVFVLELDSEESSSFEQFQQRILNATLEVDASPNRGYRVSYESPSVGTVTVTWDGAMTVSGDVIDLGPYDRYNNPFCNQQFGSLVAEIRHNDELLSLDFSSVKREFYGEDGDGEESEGTSSDEGSRSACNLPFGSSYIPIVMIGAGYFLYTVVQQILIT